MNLIKKNIEHLENILDYIVEHLLCIVVLILIFIISFIVLKFLPFSMPKDVQSQEIYVGGISLNNVSIWFTAIGLIITAFWTIYQYTKNTSRKQQEKGANLAKEFSNSLLLKCGIVTVVYKNSRLYKILNSHREYDSFRNFTISELREVYNNDLPYIYRDLEKECKLDDIYHDILRKRITPYSKIKDNTYPIFCKENNHVGIIFLVYNKVTLDKFFKKFNMNKFYLEEKLDNTYEYKIYYVNKKVFFKDKIKIYDPEINKMCEKISKILKLEVFSVDLIKIQDEYYVIDVNPSSAFYLSNKARLEFIKINKK